MRILVMAGEPTRSKTNCIQIACKRLETNGAELVCSEKTFADYSLGTPGDFFKLISECDAVIAFGGDGYMLHASRHAASFDKPILCVNCGRLGYLAGLEPSELDLLDLFARGEYSVVNRGMLDVELSGSSDGKFFALNDAVIGSGNIAKTVDISVSCAGRSVMNVRGDGVIFSTPTGSTAYSFSAGGPVVDPDINCILVTPVCPHSFASRSVIFNDKSTLCATAGRGDMYLTVDGENGIKLLSGDTVKVTKSARTVKFIKLKDQSFFDVLYAKLPKQ